MHICWCRHNYNPELLQALPRQADQLATLNLSRRPESVVKNVLFILREELVGFYVWLIFIKYRWRFIRISVNSMLINIQQLCHSYGNSLQPIQDAIITVQSPSSSDLVSLFLSLHWGFAIPSPHRFPALCSSADQPPRSRPLRKRMRYLCAL